MKIRMLERYPYTVGRITTVYKKDGEYTVPDDVGRELIRLGKARQVRSYRSSYTPSDI